MAIRLVIFCLAALALSASLAGSQAIEKHGTRPLVAAEAVAIRGQGAYWPCQLFLLEGDCPSGLHFSDHTICDATIPTSTATCASAAVHCSICSGYVPNMKCQGAAVGWESCQRIGLVGGCGFAHVLGTSTCRLYDYGCRCWGEVTELPCTLFTVQLQAPGCGGA